MAVQFGFYLHMRAAVLGRRARGLPRGGRKRTPALDPAGGAMAWPSPHARPLSHLHRGTDLGAPVIMAAAFMCLFSVVRMGL